eukprot:10472991-Karenia_brevis.AAC.1
MQPQKSINDAKNDYGKDGPKPDTDPYAPTQLGDSNGKWVNHPDATIAPGLALVQYQGRTYNRNKKMPDTLTVQVPDFTAGRGKDGNWFPNVHEIERWVRQIALACADASPFTDGKEVDFIDDIYTNFVKDGRFSDVAYSS